MSSKKHLLMSTCMGAALLSTGHQAVVAQDDEEFVLEEIIVTARLREETLQDTPLSITAMTGDALEKRGITDIREMMNQVPGVYFTNQGGPGLGNVSMRGLSQGSLIGDEANVATFVDGFYWAGRIAFDAFIDGMERVEVVRGPQSALYGRNSFSGAVNYITKKPNMTDTEGGFKLSVGEHGRRIAGFNYSGPLVEDKVAVRIDATHMETGGSWVNPTNEERLNDANSENIRAQIRFTPSETVTVDYAFTYVDRKTTDQPLYGIPYNEMDSGYKFDFITFNYRNHKVQNPENRPSNDLDRYSSDLVGSTYDVKRHTLKIDWEADNFLMSALIAHTDEEISTISDATYGLGGEPILTTLLELPSAELFPGGPVVPTGAPPVSFGNGPMPVDLDGNFIPDLFPVIGGQPNQSRKDFSGELRFQSINDGPLQWAFGGFFARLKYDDRLETGYDIDAATMDAAVNWVPTGPGFPAYLINAGIIPATYSCNPMPPFTGCMGPPALVDTWGVENGQVQLLQDKYFVNEETSVFLSLDYEISDRTSVTVEGRYTWEDRYMEDRVEVTRLYDASFSSPIEKSYKTFTPRVILDHKVNEDTFLYAIAGKGAKAGGVQPSATAGRTFYDPETNWTYEVGTKLTLLDGHMNLNMAAFFVDWTDMQLRENVGLDNIVTNLGQAEVKGFEIMGAWKVHQNVQFRFGYTYQDGKITEGSTASAAGYCDIPHLEKSRVDISSTQAGLLYTSGNGASCGLEMNPVTVSPFAPPVVIPFVSTGSILVTTGNIAGNRMSNAPKHTATLGFDIDIPINDELSFFTITDLNYRSQTYLDFDNWVTIPSVTLLSAQVGIQAENWRFAVWANNLTNNDTPIAAIRNFSILGQQGAGVQHREKRMFGATFSYTF
ncbi:TonB-dependent receptor [Temperatibacter marinus]|uniref:TonB-dependent receptor n=1 Tax=Temperatibacter marinus TaxID=1456591 RepID=A0AA52EDK9_9PROT|nr:TonB-dependent receptor [Temperatibacter marinus]WND03512.1 TonB-dependent receptor [Temperatibacter marinus]